MARRRKNIEAFSLSFLDCICCGFGAIILLLVLSKIYEPVVVEESEQNLEQLIALLQEELFNLRGETTVLDRELKKVREDASSTQLELAQLQGDLNKVRGQYEASQQEEEATIDEGELSAARQRLTEEMKRLFDAFPKDAHPMAIMCGVVGTLSAFYHDSAAALVQDGRITAAAQLEVMRSNPHPAIWAPFILMGQP